MQHQFFVAVGIVIIVILRNDINCGVVFATKSRTTIENDTIKDRNDNNNNKCVCGIIPDRPNIWNKVETARWMVHHIDWGVLTTISTRTIHTNNNHQKDQHLPIPFGNVYSFIDGSCTNATGIPYFYGTYMDQSLQDMKSNAMASLTLSEASIQTSCMEQQSTDGNPIRQSCYIVPESIQSLDSFSNTMTESHHHHSHDSKTTTTSTISESGDPESPICARLTLTGILEPISKNTMEYEIIQLALYERHPQMQYWPKDHNWILLKLNIIDIWLIDYFGGATILTPEQYFHPIPSLSSPPYYNSDDDTTSNELDDPV
jgi:hypothetical protein